MGMKATLILMRHGEARDTTSGNSDIERALTPKGEEQARAQGQALVQKNIKPDIILCSSALRTRQTADILVQAWQGAEPPIEHRTDMYQATPAEILRMIRVQDSAKSTVMVIGHNPTIHQLAMNFCAPGEYSKQPKLGKGYPPAAMALFEFNLRALAEIGEGRGILIDFITPNV
jgi:phosphohistidine phosphatase